MALFRSKLYPHTAAMSQQKIILVAGPTASGKSALALDLAKKHNGTIINADAMQIYEGLPILSAQPSDDDQKTIPHELYGIMNPAEASSAGKWLSLATAAIKRAAAGRTPILVGGTGLYFRALLGGLAEIPPIPPEVRVATQKLYDESGEETFRNLLKRLDPDSVANLARNDRQRLIRAYEVVTHTGKTLKQWHANRAIAPKAAFEPHLLLPAREKLYAACDQRFEAMIKHGAIEEAKAFLARNLNPDLPAMKTIGIRELAAFLNGETPLEAAIAQAQQATRNYAKRQLTWFRNQKLIPE